MLNTSMDVLKRTLKQGAFAALAVCASAATQAELITSFTDKPAGRNDTGALRGVEVSYDTQNSRFTWSSVVLQHANMDDSDPIMDSFWLVVSNGPDPKSDVDEYAILYGDLNTGRLTAYSYNGGRDNSSWREEDRFIQDFGTQIEVTTSVAQNTGRDRIDFNFSINANFVNMSDLGPDWEGISLESEGDENPVGIWFHGYSSETEGSFEYDDLGRITSAPLVNSTNSQTNFDAAAIDSTTTDSPPPTGSVPTPGVLSLMAIAMLGFIAPLRRKRKLALVANK